MSDFLILARWRQWLKVDHSEKTVRLYTYGAYRFFVEFVEGPPGEATEEQLVEFLNSLDDHSQAKAKYLLGVRSLLQYCVKRGHADRDITEGIHLRKPKRRPQVALTPVELYRLFCVAYEREPRRAWALMLSFGLGTRRMEVCGIDPDRDIQGDEVELRNCKGGKTRRVPMTEIAKEALKQLRPYWNGTVFGGITEQTLTDWGQEAAREAGLYNKVRGRTTHVYRATYVTLLLRAGVPVQDVADLAGHENIATTDSYAVRDPEQARQGVIRSGL